MSEEFNTEENVEEYIHIDEVPDIPEDYMKLGTHKGVSKASFITGLIGMIFSIIPCLTVLSIPLGIVALITGFISVKEEETKKKSMLGIIFGGAGIVVCVLLVIISWTLQFLQDIL